MGLDVLTPKGQESREHEDAAVALWHSRFPLLRYMHTPKGSPAKPDAILVRGEHSIYAVVEMKCRPGLSLDKFMREFKGEWLVTYQKMVDCVQAAQLLHVPFVGMLYLVDENVLLYKVLWTPEEGYVATFTVRRTETQATVNGGLAVRANAYIDMRDARRV